MREAWGHQQGLTLVELLLAVFIFVAAGAGLLEAYLSTNLLTQVAKETMVANDDLRDLTEHLQATPFNLLLTRFPSGAVNGPANNNYAGIVGGYTLKNQQIVVTYPAQSASRLEVLVTLTWTSRGVARTQALSTVRTGA